MPSIQDTTYPRIKSTLTEKELDEVYTSQRKEILDILEFTIIDLLHDFDEHGNGEYMEFLEWLADSHSDDGLKDLLTDVKESLQEDL